MRNHNTRIAISMTREQAILSMADGNIGAIVAMTQLIKRGNKIDPDSFDGGLAAIISCDTLGIYGPRIWMLFKDVCGEDSSKMIAVLRAWQMGQLAGTEDEKINHAIDNGGEGLDLEAIMAAVKDKLPRFSPEI